MDGSDPTQDAAVALAHTLAERMTRWDSPALLAAIHLGADEADDPHESSLRWQLSTVGYLSGHPFDALIGLVADDDAVGAALACEGYVVPRLDRTAIDDDLAEHTGPDGRAEIRDVLVMMRDGTVGHVVSVRGGGLHRTGPGPSGQVPAALARHLGRPSGLTPPGPHEVAARMLLWAAARSATGTETPVVESITHLADRPASWLALMPGPFAWLATVARLAAHERDEVTWDEVRERLVDLPRLAADLLEGSVTSADHCLQDPSRSVRWCDGPLIGQLFDSAVPAWAEIEVAVMLSGAGDDDAPLAELVALARAATGS